MKILPENNNGNNQCSPAVVGCLSHHVADFEISATGSHDHCCIQKLIGMVDGKNHGPSSGQSVPSNHFNVSEEGAKYGIDEHLCNVVQQFFEFTDPYIDAKEGTYQCNVPWGHRWKHMHEQLHWIEGIHCQNNGAQQHSKDHPGEGHIGDSFVGAAAT